MIDLNDIAVPKTRHDLAAVKERLACTAADWLPELFPEARLARDRRSLRCADLSGRPPRKEGSCTIHLDGPYAGWGFDYATGERAGPIDLIAQATGLCDGALFDEAARLAGMDLPAPRPAPASPMRARPDHTAEIARLVGGAVPIAGTPGETYLRARGVSDPGSPDLLFHPDLPDFDSCRGWPGLIAILRLPDAERAPGIHRTFLLDDGSAKAPPGKKMLGSVKDAVVRLFPMPEDGHIGIAEGIETALAAQALFGTPAWAALSADGLPPGAPRPSALSQAVVFGAPEAVLLDLPQLTEDQPAHRPFAAAHAVPWPGEMAVFRSPSTDGFELLTTFGTRARLGTLVSDFFAGPTSRFDLGNALVVDLLTGTLESVTDLTLFGGANALAIESAPGVWEIVQAGAAELLAPGRYRLTRLLRGQRGTEGAMGNPVPAGARVVVLDTALASLPIAEADLGIPWNWRIGPASRPVSDETYVAQAFPPEGVGLRPFSVAHVEQPWRRPRTPGDLTIRWTRRSRALSADSWGGLEVPLGEELEAYEVEILNGATVKRVLSTATTSAVYTAADQTADWGAPLEPGDTLDIRIYQLSALVGRGAPKTVTLTF